MDDQTPDALVSAVILPMPPEVRAFTEAFRQEHRCWKYQHVPPHITLMWPFVSPGKPGAPDRALLAATTKKLRVVCREVAPFSVTLDHYDSFPDSGVLYLAPRDPEPISRLHRHILAAYPDYPPYEGMYNDYIPHMTLGFFESPEAIARACCEPFEPFTFEASELLFMVGDPDFTVPWSTAGVIPLGG